MKHRIILPLLLLTLCLLSACGASSGVSEKQVKEDLIAREEIQSCHTSRFSNGAPYELKEYALIKEQINEEDKEDIVYCDLVVSDGQFEVVLSVRALYNYYDKGGWIMDELSPEVIEVTPISAPDAEKVVAYIRETELADQDICYSYQNDTDWVKGGTLNAEGSSFDRATGCAIIYATYASTVRQINGHYDMNFNGADWDFAKKELGDTVLVVDQVVVDFSQKIGAYKIPYNYPTGTLTIHEVTDNSIEYSVHFDGGNRELLADFQEGDRLTAVFDPISCESIIGKIYFSYEGRKAPVDVRLTFDNESGEWQLSSPLRVGSLIRTLS